MTYTRHKLTDSMLQHLSATVNGRRVGGNSMRALADRGLLQWTDSNEWKSTMKGRQALAEARREGW